MRCLVDGINKCLWQNGIFHINIQTIHHKRLVTQKRFKADNQNAVVVFICVDVVPDNQDLGKRIWNMSKRSHFLLLFRLISNRISRLDIPPLIALVHHKINIYSFMVSACAITLVPKFHHPDINRQPPAKRAITFATILGDVTILATIVIYYITFSL